MTTDRQCWLSVLARTPAAEMEAALARVDLPPADWPRPAQEAMIGLEARAGGTGQRFTLGQATVTRATCVVNGAVGVGFVIGHDPRRAELMALCDALLQGDEGPGLQRDLVEPLARAQAEARAERARAAAATRVEFFTMERNSGAGTG